MKSTLLPGRSRRFLIGLIGALLISNDAAIGSEDDSSTSPHDILGKPVVYQVFTRLFGNKKNGNLPWGTLEENGSGKFADITDTALHEIHDLGVSHIWYTGVLHHASVTDYSRYGIPPDDPDVVKGRAGSPYAIRDYYSVDPDLAIDPRERLREFDALIARSHKAGLKVIIDIVPNHVARAYRSLDRPEYVEDFGASDDTTVVYKRDNDFYYVPGEAFQVPVFPEHLKPLGGEAHPLADGKFTENPARWTGNGARRAQPNADDWYETVRINFGVKPDGSYDFDALPRSYAGQSASSHAEFWRGRDVPGSWHKFEQIAHYWLDRGVDGFRYDMAGLVPVEFWSFLNASIKQRNPKAVLIAEIYDPDRYRDYVDLGLMDYLYAKVDVYDTLVSVIKEENHPASIRPVQQALADIDDHMITFLENHDEWRIASPAFAGNPWRALPAMHVTALLGQGATMIYFGQEVGEAALKSAGFGPAHDTTIFDYWGVEAHQQWMNDGRFDGGGLDEQTRTLRQEYAELLRFARDTPAMRGNTLFVNTATGDDSADSMLAFLRVLKDQSLLVVSNFSRTSSTKATLELPVDRLQLTTPESLASATVLGQFESARLVDKHRLDISLGPLQTVVIDLGTASVLH